MIDYDYNLIEDVGLVTLIFIFPNLSEIKVGYNDRCSSSAAIVVESVPLSLLFKLLDP